MTRWMTPTTASAAAESLRMVGEIMPPWFPAPFQAPVTELQDSANPGSSQGFRRRGGSLRSPAVARLLVVEDDAAISEPLVRALAREGHDVEHVDRGEAALDRLDLEPVDLVVLDVGLPDLDGVEVCRRARAAHPRLAILMLTARSSELDEVLGLDAGADDYVTKPFSLSVLSARVRVLLRRRGSGGEAEVEVGGVKVDPGARRAWRDGRELELSPKEFDLLARRGRARRGGMGAAVRGGRTRAVGRARHGSGGAPRARDGPPARRRAPRQRAAPRRRSDRGDARARRPLGAPARARRRSRRRARARRPSLRTRLLVVVARRRRRRARGRARSRPPRGRRPAPRRGASGGLRGGRPGGVSGRRGRAGPRTKAAGVSPRHTGRIRLVKLFGAS